MGAEQFRQDPARHVLVRGLEDSGCLRIDELDRTHIVEDDDTDQERVEDALKIVFHGSIQARSPRVCPGSKNA
jgi:hypothetical protein